MACRSMLGVFAREADILSATEAARREGIAILDVYTPYAVHVLDQAMGLLPSRLPISGPAVIRSPLLHQASSSTRVSP